MRSVWLHVHVPKAGGSTIRQLMNRSFGKGYYNSTSLLESKKYTREDVSEIIRCHPWLLGFSDHKLSLDLPYDCEHAKLQALCFVRDPVERFISRYNFHRNFEEVNCIAQQLTFRQFAEKELIEEFAPPDTNSQVNFLNRGTDKQDLSVIHAAIETGQVWLFPIEEFDQACCCMETMFPETFTDLSYVKVNTSSHHEEISIADREFVTELLKTDEPVLKLAYEQLEVHLSSAFETPTAKQSAMQDFQDRCSRRYHNFRPLRAAGEPLPAEIEIATDKSTNLPDRTNPANS